MWKVLLLSPFYPVWCCSDVKFVFHWHLYKPVEPVLNGQPVLSGQLAILQGWPFSTGLTVFIQMPTKVDFGTKRVNRGDRLKEVTFRVIKRKKFRDFYNWPLNRGWPFNTGPLNTGLTVDVLPLVTSFVTWPVWFDELLRCVRFKNLLNSDLTQNNKRATNKYKVPEGRERGLQLINSGWASVHSQAENLVMVPLLYFAHFKEVDL